MATLEYENPINIHDLTGTSVGPFATDFTAEEAIDVEVYYWPAGLRPILLVKDVDYTLSGATPTVNGYNVTLTGLYGELTAWDAGDRLWLCRATEENQGYDFQDSLGIKPSLVKRMADRLTRIAQEIGEKSGRALQVLPGENGVWYPSAEERANKILGHDGDGNPTADRSLVDFDSDVAATAANKEAADEAAALAATEANNAHQYLIQSQTVFNDIELETLNSVSTIILEYQAARNELTATKDAAVVVIEGREGDALDNIDAAKTDAVNSITEDKQTVLDARDEVVSILEEQIAPLPDRVAALEAAGATVSLAAYVGGVLRTVAEFGESLTVTLTRITTLAMASVSINQGVGAVAATAGTVSGIATGAAVTADKTWTATFTPAVGDARTASATIDFRYRFFAGVYATGDLDAKTAAQIRTALLAGSSLATNATRSFSVDAGSGSPQYVYFAIPHGWSLSAFSAYGFDELSTLVMNTVNIDDYAGADVSYDLYRMPNPLNGVVNMVANG